MDGRWCQSFVIRPSAEVNPDIGERGDVDGEDKEADNSQYGVQDLARSGGPGGGVVEVGEYGG